MQKNDRPWITGPQELLNHGVGHLQGNATDFDRRIALISIDNAVELMIKTYLGQPRRSLGKHIPRKRLDAISESFPELLDALEEFAKDRLGSVDLSDLEYFHRLRNQLYHAGNGLTVEQQKVMIYAQIAEQLFVNLFKLPPSEQAQPDTTSEFLHQLSNLQSLSEQLAKLDGISHAMGYQPGYLALTKRFSDYDEVLRFRHNLVHSNVRYSETELCKRLGRVKEMVQEASKEFAQGTAVNDSKSA